MSWLSGHLADIFVLTCIITLVCVCAASLFTGRSKCASCGCGKNCAGCAMCCSKDLLKKIRES